MNRQVLARRLEMLTLRSKGVNMTEVVNEIADKYERKVGTIWNDWTYRENWLAQVVNIDKSSQEVFQGMREVIRSGWFLYTTSPNESVRLGALKLIKDCYVQFVGLAQSLGLLTLKPAKLDVRHDITKLLDEYKDIYEEEEGEAQPIQENSTGEPVDTV